MGGKRETKVETKVVREKYETIELGLVRIHEKDGMVHFHDDTKGLKVACPVAKWFSAWDAMSQSPGEWTYVDKNTAIGVITRIDNGTLDALISIYPVKIGDTFAKLHKFTGG